MNAPGCQVLQLNLCSSFLPQVRGVLSRNLQYFLIMKWLKTRRITFQLELPQRSNLCRAKAKNLSFLFLQDWKIMGCKLNNSYLFVVLLRFKYTSFYINKKGKYSHNKSSKVSWFGEFWILYPAQMSHGQLLPVWNGPKYISWNVDQNQVTMCKMQCVRCNV